MKMKDITQELVLSMVEYKDGHFYWKHGRGRQTSGNIMYETKSKSGYVNIKIKGDKRAMHRIVWLYHNGELPNCQIDHINHDRKDNRIENLRVVNHVENGRNKGINVTNTSGTTGVYLHKSGKWASQIQVLGKTYVKYFTDKDLAIAYRKELVLKYKFHKNHGKQM